MFEQGLKLLHDLRLLGVKIRRLAGIGGEVVELGGGFGIGFGQGEGLEFAFVVVVSAGAAVGDVFPLTATNRKGALACKGLGEQIRPDGSGGSAFEGDWIDERLDLPA